MPVKIMPTVRRQRAWLDREALRIVAAVRTASVRNVLGAVWRGHQIVGLDPDLAAADVDEVEDYLIARIAQIEALLGRPITPTGRGRHHG